jgi:hypothetical protein
MQVLLPARARARAEVVARLPLVLEAPVQVLVLVAQVARLVPVRELVPEVLALVQALMLMMMRRTTHRWLSQGIAMFFRSRMAQASHNSAYLHEAHFSLNHSRSVASSIKMPKHRFRMMFLSRAKN